MDVVFSFDTTGSMSQVLDEVKGRMTDIVQRLQADIPGFQVGVIAHGDYCDADHFYDIRTLDLTNCLPDVVTFVTNTDGTGGGDIPECYELALRHANQMSWTAGSQRILVVIGDAYPHGPDYALNKLAIDWQKEMDALVNKGVRIYGVQVQEDPESTQFFQELTNRSGGQHLKLANMHRICDVIMGICYREKGPQLFQNYEAEVRQREAERFGNDLECVFGTLRPEEDNDADTEQEEERSTVETPRPNTDAFSVRPDAPKKQAQIERLPSYMKGRKVLKAKRRLFKIPEVDFGYVVPKLQRDESRSTEILDCNDVADANDFCQVRNMKRKRDILDDESMMMTDVTDVDFRKVQNMRRKQNVLDDDSVCMNADAQTAETKAKKARVTARRLKAQLAKEQRPKRESIAAGKLVDQSLPWSRWTCAVRSFVHANSPLPTVDKKRWKVLPKCGTKDALWRKDLLSLWQSKSPPYHGKTTMFELALAKGTHGRKRATYFRVKHGGASSLAWYRKMFSQVRTRINQAVCDGQSVYMRWAETAGVKAAFKYSRDYKYAWKV